MDYYHPSLHPMAATTVTVAPKDPQDRYHHPTPPYHYYGEDKPVAAAAPSASASATTSYHQNAPYQQHMATPSYSFPHSQEQRHHHPPPPTHSHSQQQDSYPLPPRQVQQEFKHHARKSSDMALIVLNNTAPAATAVPPPKLQSSPSSKSQQRQTAAELADFAAHMVCYLLFGHAAKSSSSSSSGSGNNCSSVSTHGSPGPSRPCSPQTPSGSRQPQSPYSNCPCGVCLQQQQQQQQHQDSQPNSPSRSSCPTSSSNTVVYPSWQQQQQQQQPTRSTHRRMLSESEIVQPKPMFRKFCLDVLSATLLSPSVILLSLKYIQQLMVNLKSSNKIVNTGEGAEYRFFTGALILANKFLDDNTFTNKTWSDITGMKVKDVNHLEMQFLNGIDFRLFTSPAEYSEWLAGLTQFTGQYMPSQHQVASQQQATAARSPISPVDTTNVDSTPLSGSSVAQVGAANGAGAVADSSAGSRPVNLSGSGSMATTHFSNHGGYSQAPAPAPTASSSMSLSMASISHYIDSVKQIQNRNRVVQGQPLAPVASYAQQYQHQHHGSLTPFTQSPTGGVYPSFSQQTSPLPMMHRKRSAHIAFEDMSLTDRSPGYESSGNQSSRPSVFVRSHKRFSSSSASTAMMATPVYHGSEQDHMFRAGHSPLPPPPPSRQPYQSQYPIDDRSHRPSSSLGSNGSMPFARKQHQRSASGTNYGMEVPEYSAPSSTLTTPRLQDPVSVRGQYMLASHGTTGSSHSSTWARSQLHPLEAPQPELSLGRPSSRISSTASRPQSQQAFYHPVTPPSSYHRHHYQHHPESPPFLDSHSYHNHHDCHEDYHSHRNSPYGHSSYEIDPRLWGPLDSMSLQAITTQAAKRVVAQGKALSSSANGLHMYYPSTLV